MSGKIGFSERIEFCSTLPVEMRPRVEELFFFNPRQAFSRHGIAATVEQTGVPAIIERDGRIWIGVPSGTTQCLFAFDRSAAAPRPVGVLLYERPARELIRIAHLAVDPAYPARQPDGEAGLGCILVEKIREIARTINGVTRIQLPYRRDCFLRVQAGDGGAARHEG